MHSFLPQEGLRYFFSFKVNKTKVLSVKLGKTLGLTKVPITETEESTQVRKLGLKLFEPKGGVVIIKEGGNFGV